tara:strand:- start:876 stop:1289 length:414 start_codon:yes stop_codon:yes gene_type:complete
MIVIPDDILEIIVTHALKIVGTDALDVYKLACVNKLFGKTCSQRLGALEFIYNINEHFSNHNQKLVNQLGMVTYTNVIDWSSMFIFMDEALSIASDTKNDSYVYDSMKTRLSEKRILELIMCSFKFVREQAIKIGIR